MTKNTIEQQYHETPLSGGAAMNYTLWFVQTLLALIFLFSGGMKLVVPFAEMAKQMPIPLPSLFVHFIGTAEVLGALGLILPRLLHIRESLTPLAASGLVIIMAGATTYMIVGGGGPAALLPLVVGLLSTFVAFGRRL